MGNLFGIARIALLAGVSFVCGKTAYDMGKLAVNSALMYNATRKVEKAVSSAMEEIEAENKNMEVK